MPSVLIIDGYRFYFYANEGNEPAHIHVYYNKAVAKFWLEPVVLAKNLGMTAGELSKASHLTKENSKFLKEKWDEFRSKKT